MSEPVQPTRERLEDLFRQVAKNARLFNGEGFAYTIDELVDSAVDAAFTEPQGA